MNEPSADKGTILIVDDTPANVAVLFDHLSRSGFKVLVAEKGASALMQAKHAQPDLILLDVMMPELDGFEVCARLRKLPGGADVPVMMMTGSCGWRSWTSPSRWAAAWTCW